MCVFARASLIRAQHHVKGYVQRGQGCIAGANVTPEAYDGGLLAKVRDGDIIRVNGQTGELTLLVDEAELAARQPHIPDLSASRIGTGREMFGALREQLSGAEQGATCIHF